MRIMNLEFKASTIVTLFILGTLSITAIEAHRSIMNPSVDEEVLQDQAENFCQALSSAEYPPATYPDFDEFLDSCSYRPLRPFYGEAQLPGEIGYQPLFDQLTIVGWRVTAMGNSGLVYDRSVDY